MTTKTYIYGNHESINLGAEKLISNSLHTSTGSTNIQALTLCLVLKKGTQTEMYLSTVRATVVKQEPAKEIWVAGIRNGRRWT